MLFIVLFLRFFVKGEGLSFRLTEHLFKSKRKFAFRQAAPVRRGNKQ